MEELAVKKNFTNIYTQKFPNAYLREMKRLDYRIPDKTKPLYLSIAKQLYNKLQKKNQHSRYWQFLWNQFCPNEI